MDLRLRRASTSSLSGESEVELEGGRKIHLRPGNILLVEDTTGQRHISRAIGSGDRTSFVHPARRGGRGRSLMAR